MKKIYVNNYQTGQWVIAGGKIHRPYKIDWQLLAIAVISILLFGSIALDLIKF